MDWRCGWCGAFVVTALACQVPVATDGEARSSSGAATTTAGSSEDGGADVPQSTMWLALGQGETVVSPLVDGGELMLVLGGQGAWMFPIDVRGKGFALPRDPADLQAEDVPRLDLWLDMDGFAISIDGHLAQIDDLPLVFTVGTDGVYETGYVPLIVPEVLSDMRELDGRAGRLHAALATADGALTVDLDVVVRAPVGDGGGGSGGSGGTHGEIGETAGGPVDPQFVDVTAEVGLTYTQGPKNLAPNCKLGYANNPTGDLCQTERMIAGAAVGDVDADGDDDLYVTRLDAPNHLFINEGGTFVDRAAEVGLAVTLPSSGVVWIDIDRDGDLDLYLTTLGDTRYYLYVNHGGQFSEDALGRGAAIESMYLHAGMTPAIGDYDLDGYLDLFTGEWRLQTVIWEGPYHARLLRNRGVDAPGSFEDTTDSAGVPMYEVGNMLGPLVFSPAFVDLDEDGWPDLPVVADFATSRLFWNTGDGTFIDGTAAAKVGAEDNGMGSTFGDFDGDGRLDWFVSSIYVEGNDKDDGNRLYRNLGGREFADATDEAGVRDGGWGWGAAAFDYDNDGDLDLVQTGGWDTPAFTDQRLRLWRDAGGFPLVEVGSQVGLDDVGDAGRAVVVWDYDGDGDLDLLVTHNAGMARLFRNDGGDQHDWLRVRAVGKASNRQGIGAKVQVRAAMNGALQVREIGASTHFMGQSEAVAHFGLGHGEAPVAEVRVEWPVSGAVQIFNDVPRRSLLTAYEP